MRHLLILLAFATGIQGIRAQTAPLFELLSTEQTGVDFRNNIVENNEEDNVLAYEYYYNGGGVAAGDLDNDGLPELFFTSNRESNHLYLNLGGLTFRDISKSAGIGGRKNGWKTGVTFADVNADGWLDIYVCYSGRGDDNSRRNQLFINQKNLSFKDEAQQYGLDDPGYSTQAAFFDYDRDGDLDCFLLNHNIGEYRNFENDEIRRTRDPLAGDKLYENRDGRFVDVSEQAGIPGNPLGFGLGVAVSDFNADGWLDIYVSNDYNEPDYLLINDGKGHFSEQAATLLGHMSHFSMGCDAADLNNDGHPDLLTLDMLPPDNRRQKLLQGPENYEVYEMMVKSGRHKQFMRNMLHLSETRPVIDPKPLSAADQNAWQPWEIYPNLADPSPTGKFCEIGQLAGISNTDWSWSALIADFDNDGWKDIYITNGYLRDYTNRDFLRFWGDYLVQKAAAGEKPSLLELVKKMPASRLHNYLYRNDGTDETGRPKLTFTDMSAAWGADQPAVSSGATYADLDADGDLEIIVSNINEPAFIYKNKARETNGNDYLDIKLEGPASNPYGIGATVRVLFTDYTVQMIENIPTRGYQSGVTEILHLGLGKKKVQSVDVIWGNGLETLMFRPRPNERLRIGETSFPVVDVLSNSTGGPGFWSAMPHRDLPFRHEEYDYNDFKRQPLLPHMLSRVGPQLAAADLDGDGLDDLFVGASKWQTSRLYLQTAARQFVETDPAMFKADQFMTVADAVFFDANGDKKPDLYLVAGGYEDYAENDPALNDALYLCDGQGRLIRTDSLLPDMPVSKSCARPYDFDSDGDLDLFVGGRVIPGQYPLAPRSFLLQNDGTGRFTDVTAALAPALLQPGMVTDAAWADLDADGRAELLICGEWMPIRVFSRQNDGSFVETSARFFERPFSGWWNCLLLADFDHDGDPDLLGGNLGLNSQLKASEKEPATLVYRDFDGNGSIDPILCFYNQGKSYPFLTRDELLEQITAMRPRFTSYEQYASATLPDIFTAEELAGADTLRADHLATSYFENQGGHFVEKNLPVEAQFAPVFAAMSGDFHLNGKMELMLAGNLDGARLRFGCYDAGHAPVFELHNGQWRLIDHPFGVQGDVRSVVELNTGKSSKSYVFGVNNAPLRIYQWR
ncbi:MAG: VCBS repeat-containing protein [Saprospiraceae bacterium]|nr:VCBS repeat-containing protein [Saprospiraceae bacterium]